MSTTDTAAPARGAEPQWQRHSWFEDAAGMGIGILLASFGLFLIREAGAVTGGTAGLALLIEYASGVPLSVLFPLVNVPFFALAVWKMGWDFTLRTLVAVLLSSALIPLHGVVLGGAEVNPIYGTIVGNIFCGMGVLALVRHKSSIGGINVLALILQEKVGWRAGYVQMGIDVLIVLGAFFVLPWQVVLLSAVGAVVLNIVLAINHRPGRYTGRSGSL